MIRLEIYLLVRKERSLPGGIIAPGKSLAYISELAQALRYSVSWDAESKAVVVDKHDA